ncbi:DEAD/DEAH box helicase [Plasticicumulans sp.]|uniref:DEAD/DEAH box helicase n=1 Tax=Plasticicumulans sp. TaxID=2307179 RepID=UPI00393F68BD
MDGLRAHDWQCKYSPGSDDLVRRFYKPALACAVRYDRTTGYFSAGVLVLAARGIERLVRNQGRMRLIVGCTLDAGEVAAIEQGLQLRTAIAEHLQALPLDTGFPEAVPALELLAWMVEHGVLEVRIAVPCGPDREPLATALLFHEKAGIIEDATGARIAFSGSLNETVNGWHGNWESFHVFCSWNGGVAHVDAEEQTFDALWHDRASHARVLDVPAAIRACLLPFLPPDDGLPKRLREEGGPYAVEPPDEPPVALPVPEPPPSLDERAALWRFVAAAPNDPAGGERVGEATSAVTPWPHQVRAFERLYRHWPPRLLIADEVGLGKTIQAGLLLRQSWLAGKARRILVMVPKAVLPQWQIELREKFNLNWPIYDGQSLAWCPSPALGPDCRRKVTRKNWHREPCVLVSSHLMRRGDRFAELTADAEPWDLIVLDEAHHARRRSGGLGADNRPNQLLRLMQTLAGRTQALLLLTATPMQVSPVEVWDLLALLGLPLEWNTVAFLDFFQLAAKPAPAHEEFDRMARQFQAAERAWGEVSQQEVQRGYTQGSAIKARRILKALRDVSSIPRNQLDAANRRMAIALMRGNSPTRRLISRNTRELLRQYFRAGKLDTPIAERDVRDRFVEMSPAERALYEEVERYISTTYNHAAQSERTAVGFVMTIYRRRLASSFAALRCTLEARLQKVRQPDRQDVQAQLRCAEDASDDELVDEVMDADEAEALEQGSLAREEQADIEYLLLRTRALPTDTKALHLTETLRQLQADGYAQAIVFTQFTDTLDFLRELLIEAGMSVICYSGRGGEMNAGGDWKILSREETRRRFRNDGIDVLICTDAAAEGLNFQFCGALINYDMPWNPMRVEQRIGRIDRLGQVFPHIRIVNLHYEDTVETDVYRALRERIGLFQSFVGRLQPILARLPRAIETATLGGAQAREHATADVLAEAERLRSAAPDGFDLDEITAELSEPLTRPAATYDLDWLKRNLLEKPDRLPPGAAAQRLGDADFAYLRPGLAGSVRVTTDAAYYEEHADSVELWSPGSPLFPRLGEDGNASA